MTDQQVANLVTALQRRGHENPAGLVRIVGKLFAAFDRDGAPAQRVAVYVEDLSDLPMADVERACTELRRESKFLPTIAELRARVTDWQMNAAGVNTSPETAWLEVMRLVQSAGTRRIPGRATDHGPAVEFADPVTAAIMTPTWWRALGQAPVDSIPSERHRFCEAYKAQTARVRRQIQCGTGPALPSATAQHQLDGGHR